MHCKQQNNGRNAASGLIVSGLLMTDSVHKVHFDSFCESEMPQGQVTDI
jgi:hypothetical protein